MACDILDGGEKGAVFFDTVMGWAFGPVFRSYEHAEDFMQWLGRDPRSLREQDLLGKYSAWLEDRVDENGALREDPDFREVDS